MKRCLIALFWAVLVLSHSGLAWADGESATCDTNADDLFNIVDIVVMVEGLLVDTDPGCAGPVCDPTANDAVVIAEAMPACDWAIELWNGATGACACVVETDCMGVCGGMAQVDECGVCGGSGVPEGACDCAGELPDCAGVCGGNSMMDECGNCYDPESGGQGGWVFAQYPGLSPEFEPSIQYNGTVSCSETCGAYGAEAIGARFICNHWDGGESEGCGPYNDGEYGDANCGWLVENGVAMTLNGNTEDCAGGALLDCVLGSCSESVTWHAIECQCAGGSIGVTDPPLCDPDCIGAPGDADEDGDGVCDALDACPGIDDAFCIPDAGEACHSMPYYESVEGNIYVPMDCAPGDYDCQAREMCGFVTGEECVYQEYTCSDGGGSYYPPSTGGSSNFNFAIAYDFSGNGVIEEGGVYGGYGNICDCGGYSSLWGVASNHTFCGTGHWGLDADGEGCVPGGCLDADGDGVCDDAAPPDECDDASGGADIEWVFAHYPGQGTEFASATQYNGTVNCGATCGTYGAVAIGARFICNHWDGGEGEGCGPYNDGEYGDANCGWMMDNGVLMTQNDNTEDCAGDIASCVSGSCNEGVTWHAIECQCQGGSLGDGECEDPIVDPVDPIVGFSAGPGCTATEAEHPAYTNPAQNVVLCGNKYDSETIDSACAADWHVCKDSEWFDRYTPGEWPGGELSSWGEPQGNRCGGGVWQADQPLSTNTWGSSVCGDPYNPWNSGKFLRSDAGELLAGDGGWGGWDSGFAPTSNTTGFAVYCCADGVVGGEAPITGCGPEDACQSEDPDVTCASVDGECWCATKAVSALSGVQMCGYESAAQAGVYYSANTNCAGIAEAFGGYCGCDNCDCATNYFSGDSLSSSAMSCWTDEARWNRVGLDNVVRCANKEGVGDVDGDGVCDDVDQCPGMDDALCPPGDGGVVCKSMPYYEAAGGENVYVPMDCMPGDYDCQAREICHAVTGEECVYQEYDCYSGVSGSYYPPSTGGDSNFGFAITYDFGGNGIIEEGGVYGGYGNICDCGGYSDQWGLASNHEYCGTGHWGLDADGAECN